jgi:hypothetical protein
MTNDVKYPFESRVNVNPDHFSEVPVGTAFILTGEETVFIRIEPVYNEYGAPSNAVSLTVRDHPAGYRGRLFFFTDKDVVIPRHWDNLIDHDAGR